MGAGVAREPEAGGGSRRAAMDGCESQSSLAADSPSGLIPADHHFAKRRLEHQARWKPQASELRRLAELVNRRARQDIL